MEATGRALVNCTMYCNAQYVMYVMSVDKEKLLFIQTKKCLIVRVICCYPVPLCFSFTFTLRGKNFVGKNFCHLLIFYGQTSLTNATQNFCRQKFSSLMEKADKVVFSYLVLKHFPEHLPTRKETRMTKVPTEI